MAFARQAANQLVNRALAVGIEGPVVSGTCCHLRASILAPRAFAALGRATVDARALKPSPLRVGTRITPGAVRGPLRAAILPDREQRPDARATEAPQHPIPA